MISFDDETSGGRDPPKNSAIRSHCYIGTGVPQGSRGIHRSRACQHQVSSQDRRATRKLVDTFNSELAAGAPDTTTLRTKRIISSQDHYTFSFFTEPRST